MKNSIHNKINDCRICASSDIETFLELGSQPPANSLRTDPAQELHRIDLSLCRCPRCSTVQLTETVDPELLFRHYVWVTGTSSTAKEYAEMFCREALARIRPENSFVIEIASNDGTFLRLFKDRGLRVLGVDPAKNIAQMAVNGGIPTRADFFGEEVAKKIFEQEGAADFVFARNVIPHVADVHDVIKGIKSCLGKDGVAAIEFHYAGEIIDGLQYDSIYHEHLFYFTLKSLQYLLDMHGFVAFDLLKSPISGGSLVLYFTHKGMNRPVSGSLRSAIEEEEKAGLGTREVWSDFSGNCLAHRDMFVEIIKKHSAKDKVMIGYGASARSSTLLNFCNIDNAYLACIADQNPLKHNKFTAGTDILIVSPEKAFAMKPATVVLLAWNFRSEIMELIKEKFNFKGAVIVPLPNKPEVIII